MELRGDHRPLSQRSMQSDGHGGGEAGRAGSARSAGGGHAAYPSPYVCLHAASGGVSTEVRAEMSGHSIQTAMKYGRPKTREKERAAEALDEMVTI